MQCMVIYRIQAESFHKFDSISAFILPQSETKGKTLTFTMYEIVFVAKLIFKLNINRSYENKSSLKGPGLVYGKTGRGF